MRRVQSFLLAEEIEQPSHDNRESIGVSVVHGDFEWVEVVVCVVSDKQTPHRNRNRIAAAARRSFPRTPLPRLRPFPCTTSRFPATAAP